MRCASMIRFLILAFASLAYLANGAQAHLKISHGDTIELMLCSTGAERAVQLHLPGEPAEETEDTCCGDCAPTPAILFAPLPVIDVTLRHAIAATGPALVFVFPRSPLWPGAPPNGPPVSDKASA
ncbi:MAG: hypothetical protein AAF269_13215 [Pseudomonadota bacterium]